MFNRLTGAIKARLASRIVALMLPTWPNGLRPEYWDRNFENYVKEGYRRNEIVYACINITANTASSVALRVHDRKTDVVLPDHPLQQLINRPNREMSEYDFWSWSLTQQMLAGISYWQKIRNRAGQVIEMWPVRPDYVRPQVSDAVGLNEYHVRVMGVEQDPIQARDMITFPLRDPLNLFNHLSPVEVLSRTADVDNSLTDHIKIVIQRGGIVAAILTSKLKLRDGDVEDIRRRWRERYGSGDNGIDPAVLDSDASYQRTGMTLDELSVPGLDGRNETRICSVYQIPPILVGTSLGLARGTFSNYESARKQWWEDSLSGKYKKLLDGLQTQLADEYEDRPLLKWDFTNVAALQEERDARWLRATAAWTSGVIMRNEARKEMSLPDVGKEGNVFNATIATSEIQNNPEDDAPTEGQSGADDGVEVEQDDAADAARKRLADPATKAKPPTEPDDVEPIRPTDAARWEAMYQQMVEKVKAADEKKSAVVVAPELDRVPV